MKYKIKLAKDFIIENNIGDKNPYHNNDHMVKVFNNSKMLFDIYKLEYNLSDKDELVLSLASLFHDFNHSGGSLTDIENIGLAVSGLKQFLEENEIDYFEEIKSIIESTEFPYKEMELSILQKIMRDADTIGGVIDGWEDVVESLSKEFGKELKEFIIVFLNSISYNTDYSNTLLSKNKDEIISKLNKM